MHLAARTPAEREYWRGFEYGALRRLIGRTNPDDYDHIAFDLLKDAPDGLAQILARGYGAGMSGEPIRGEFLPLLHALDQEYSGPNTPDA